MAAASPCGASVVGDHSGPVKLPDIAHNHGASYALNGPLYLVKRHGHRLVAAWQFMPAQEVQGSRPRLCWRPLQTPC